VQAESASQNIWKQSTARSWIPLQGHSAFGLKTTGRQQKSHQNKRLFPSCKVWEETKEGQKSEKGKEAQSKEGKEIQGEESQKDKEAEVQKGKKIQES